MILKSEHSNSIDDDNLQEVTYVPTGLENAGKLTSDGAAIRKPDTQFLRFTVITAILLFMANGCCLAWPSPALVKLKSNNAKINPLGRPIRTVEISHMLGIPGMLSLVGTFLLPKLADLIGRKRSLLVIGAAMVLSISGLAFGASVNVLIVCLVIIDLAYCGTLAILPVYLSEVCEDHNKTKYGCLMSAVLPIGQLFTFLIGPTFNYKKFTLLTAVPLIPFLVLFSFAPESPVYSLMNGRTEECTLALKKLRNNKSDEEIEGDLNLIKQSLSVKEKKLGIKNLFNTKQSRIGIMLAVVPVIIQNCSGVPVVTTLIAPIFDESGSNLSGDTIAIVVGVVTIISSLIVSYTVEKTGKKPMLLISVVGTGIPITLLGIFFYLKHINFYLLPQLHWVPLVCVVAYVLAFSLGLGPISITIMTELFPFDLRSSASAFTTTINILLLTIYLSGYPLAAEHIGTHWCMLSFGTSCFLGAIFFYIALPETQGKSLIEVQKMLKNYRFFK